MPSNYSKSSTDTSNLSKHSKKSMKPETKSTGKSKNDFVNKLMNFIKSKYFTFGVVGLVVMSIGFCVWWFFFRKNTKTSTNTSTGKTENYSTEAFDESLETPDIKAESTVENNI